MVYHPPSGYIIFSLRKLNFYEGQGPRVEYEDRGPDNPKTLYFLSLQKAFKRLIIVCFALLFLLNIICNFEQYC